MLSAAPSPSRGNAEPVGETRLRRPLRVAFVDQAGAAAGGAERTLVTYLQYAPADIVPTVMLFEDGAFADELRALRIPVDVVAAPASFARLSRERLRLDAAVASIEHAVRLARRLRTLGIDVVYSNTMKAHFVCAPAARFAGIPCVMHFHDLPEGSRRQAVRAIARFGSRERIACAGVVADALGLDRMTVSYGPVALGAFAHLPERSQARAALGLPLDEPVVSIVGRINRWKGHERFVRIAAAVRAQRRAHFAIVGSPIFRDADFVPELHAQAARLGMREAISFIPWVDDVRTVFAATDVNVNCSTREPFGRSVAEAAGAGVPSVCFDDGGAAETIVDGVTGRVVPAGDEAAFARAVVEMLDAAANPQTRATVRHAARQFDAATLASEVAAVVRRAAGARR